jgi:hypothetical protein
MTAMEFTLCVNYLTIETSILRTNNFAGYLPHYTYNTYVFLSVYVTSHYECGRSIWHLELILTKIKKCLIRRLIV